MSYKLEKPYTDKQRADFIVKHNHGKGLKIEETQNALYALEADEIMQDGLPVKNPDYEAQQLEEAKALKLSEINTAKELAFKDGIIFMGAHFDCDDRAQDRTGNRLLLLNAMPVETLEWLDFDYKPVEMTALEFQGLCAAIFERVQFIEFKTWLFLEAVGSSENIEALDEIVISFVEEAKDENKSDEVDTGLQETA